MAKKPSLPIITTRWPPPNAGSGLDVFWRQHLGPAEGGQHLHRGKADLVQRWACQDIVIEARVIGIGECVDLLIDAPNA